MKIVTAAQLLEFIKMQPDDRKVDMSENYSSARYGCVMVHYGKEVLNIKKNFSCAVYSWIGEKMGDFDVCLNTSIFEIFRGDAMAFVGTYGELKTRVR